MAADVFRSGSTASINQILSNLITLAAYNFCHLKENDNIIAVVYTCAAIFHKLRIFPGVLALEEHGSRASD